MHAYRAADDIDQAAARGVYPDFLTRAPLVDVHAHVLTDDYVAAARAAGPVGRSSISPATFVKQMYAAGGKDSLDAVSVHPYSYPALPSDARTVSDNTFYQLRDVHAVMQRNGDGAKLVWLTEFGAPTATVHVRSGRGSIVIDDQRQAAIIADGLRYATQLGYVGRVFIYSIRDEKTGDPDGEKNFGVVRTDFSPKPSYTTIQQYTKAG